jgi:outer membrane receptor for ferrienterochelin and colicins
MTCLVGAPASADNAADEAEVAFVLGNTAYARGDYPQALGHYFLSYRLAPNHNVLFNIARCYEALKRYDEAYRYYGDLTTEGLQGPDRSEVEQALARIRPKVALVRITTVPPGADVYVDREDLGSRGRAPLTLALSPGTHRLMVKLDGFHPTEASAALVRGSEAAQTFALERILGEISLTGTPGAQLRDGAQGAVLGTVPGRIALPPGKHLLYASAPGHAEAPYLVEVVAGQVGPLEVALPDAAKPSGKLVVTANRDNALVRVDGRESGFTPAVITLPEGEHDVEVTHGDLQPVRQRLTVVRDREVRLEASLRYAPPPVQAAAKKLLAVDEAPASVTVVTQEEIRAFGYTTLPQALSALRGLYVSDDRQYSYLGVRGFSPPGDYNTRVLILWDGHSMNDVWAGQGYLGRELVPDLDEVDHIEVVRGPASALYGTGAFFAVINVVTRASLKGAHAEGSLGAGSLSAEQGHLAAAVDTPQASAIASGAVYSAAGADVTPLGSGPVIGLDGEHAYNGQARARWGAFSLSAFLNSRSKDIPTAPFGTTPNAAGTRITDARGFVEARFDRDFASGSALAARAYYDASRYRGYWNYGTTDAPSLESDAGGADWVGGEVRGRLRLFGGNLLTLGTDSQVQLRVYQEAFGGPDKKPLATQTRNILAAYVLDEWQIIPRVFATAALRVDKYSDLSDPLLTPRAALIVKPYARGLTKLVVGEAFRAPTVYESYYDDNLESQRAPCDPSKPCTLQPETILTAEIEHSHDITEELRATVAAYANRIQNLIVLGTDPPGYPIQCVSGPCTVYQNVSGLIHAAGVEAELRWQPARFTLVDLSYSYVYLGGTGSSFAEVQAGAPAHLASGRLLVPLLDTAVRLALSARYQSRRQISDPTQPAGEALLVGVGISGELEHLRYFAGVDNLLDTGYVLPVGADYGTSPPVPQYGRTFLVRLTGSL